MRFSTVSWVTSYMNNNPDDDIAERSKSVVASTFALARENSNRSLLKRQQSQSSISTVTSAASSTPSISHTASSGALYPNKVDSQRDLDLSIDLTERTIGDSEFEEEDNNDEFDLFSEMSAPAIDYDDENVDISPINILCIDGGGAKGWTIVPIFEALQESLAEDVDDGSGDDNDNDPVDKKEPFPNAFDLVAGTSVGGAAAMLIHKYPEYGVTTKAGREMLDRTIKESFDVQSFSQIVSTGHVWGDVRGKIYQDFFGRDAPLRQSSLMSSNQDEGDGISDNSSANDSNESTKKQYWGPKTFVVATQKQNSSFRQIFSSASASALEAMLLRTYIKPQGHSGIAPANGSSSIKMWEAVEATTAAPVVWGRTRAVRRADSISFSGDKGFMDDSDDEDDNELRDSVVDSVLNIADGGLVANNPTRHALQEAALLFPGRPLGLVISIGLGRSEDENEEANLASDLLCEDLADAVEEAGGQFVRLEPIVDSALTPTTSDPKILAKVEQDVVHFMKTSEDAKRAKKLLRQCFMDNPSIRGRYAPPPQPQQEPIAAEPAAEEAKNDQKDDGSAAKEKDDRGSPDKDDFDNNEIAVSSKPRSAPPVATAPVAGISSSVSLTSQLAGVMEGASSLVDDALSFFGIDDSCTGDSGATAMSSALWWGASATLLVGTAAVVASYANSSGGGNSTSSFGRRLFKP